MRVCSHSLRANGRSPEAIGRDASVKVAGRHEPGAEFVATKVCDGSELVIAVKVHEAVTVPSGPCAERFGGFAAVVEGFAVDADLEGIRGGVYGASGGRLAQWQVLGGGVSGSLFAALGVGQQPCCGCMPGRGGSDVPVPGPGRPFP